MESAKVVELARILETTSEICNKECKVDVWKEVCTVCKRNLKEINEISRTKH
jgi:hypothetical protein